MLSAGNSRAGYDLTLKPTQGSKIYYLTRGHVAAPKLGLLRESVLVVIQGSRKSWHSWPLNTQRQLRRRAVQLAWVEGWRDALLGTSEFTAG